MRKTKRGAKALKSTAESKGAVAKKKAIARVKLTRKARDTGGLHKLAPVAREINSRLTLAVKADGKAEDHRLSVALLLVQAQKECKRNKINFKTWVEASVVGVSYNEAKKLVCVGKADDPKLALEDLRAGTRRRVAETRERKGTTTALTAPDLESLKDEKDKKDKEVALAKEITDLAKGDADVRHVTKVAEKLGLKVVKPKDADASEEVKYPLDRLKGVFEDLAPSAKMGFLSWAADQVGAEVVHGFEAAETRKMVMEVLSETEPVEVPIVYPPKEVGVEAAHDFIAVAKTDAVDTYVMGLKRVLDAPEEDLSPAHDGEDLGAHVEEDLLDIPGFLRRKVEDS